MILDTSNRAGKMGAIIAVLVWLVGAAAVGWSGVLAGMPPMGLQVILGGLTVTCVVLWQVWPSANRLATETPVYTLVWFQSLRLVIGAAFLLLLQAGKLPRGFALPAGIGDMAVGLLGPVCLVVRPLARRRRALQVWNLLGLVDIVGVIVCAAREGSADPASMALLTRLPLSLLPTWYVPLVIMAHVVMIAKAGGRRELRAGVRGV